MIDAILLVLGVFLAHFIYEFIIRKPMLKDLSKKYVLITGCDSGFGKAMAKKLDSRGCPVFAACYTVKGAADLQQETSSRLQTLQLDVTKEDSIKHAFKFVSNRIPNGEGLWGLVNNAGVSGFVAVPTEFHIRRDFQDVLDVNLLGMIDMCVAFLPLLKITKGRIVNMASVAGRTSSLTNLPYFISKWGVETFSDGLRMYTKQFSIHTSIIEPTMFATNLANIGTLGKSIQVGYNRLPDEYKNTVLVPNYVEKSIKLFTPIMDKWANPDLSIVVDAYFHGLFAVHPKKRYTVGSGAKMFVASSYLPSWLSDFFAWKQMNAIRKELHRQ